MAAWQGNSQDSAARSGGGGGRGSESEGWGGRKGSGIQGLKSPPSGHGSMLRLRQHSRNCGLRRRRRSSTPAIRIDLGKTALSIPEAFISLKRAEHTQSRKPVYGKQSVKAEGFLAREGKSLRVEDLSSCSFFHRMAGWLAFRELDETGLIHLCLMLVHF